MAPRSPHPERKPVQANEDAVRISLSDGPRSREQALLDGRLIVRSPYGLKPQDRMLLEAADSVPATRILTVAMFNPVPALALAALRPEASVSVYHYDLFHIRQAESLAGGHRPGQLSGPLPGRPARHSRG